MIAPALHGERNIPPSAPTCMQMPVSTHACRICDTDITLRMPALCFAAMLPSVIILPADMLFSFASA